MSKTIELDIPRTASERMELSSRTAVVAAITNEGPDLYIMIGPGDHYCRRWKLSESLARKLFRELAERLI